ncbi:hypothetical protein [Caballeronia sp. ATUFL_M2_KS44]|uniref:hypothetical protein n=1 Tax=Caballeronia sp. ATUFL_M2_KS44 TaxID=2921767 RepID=UPI00202799B5|nr:hypothetical protein [Caballeronia sp. ATUFL_M2_KS44]
MKTLTILDLPVTEELDRRAMSAVRGGSSFYFPGYDVSKYDLTFNTQQLIDQSQSTESHNGVNVAFANDITSNVKPKQEAHNTSTINIGSGFMVR